MAFRTLFVLCRGGQFFVSHRQNLQQENGCTCVDMHVKIALTDPYLQWINQMDLWCCYERWVRSLRSPFLTCWQKDPHCPETVSQSTETIFFPRLCPSPSNWSHHSCSRWEFFIVCCELCLRFEYSLELQSKNEKPKYNIALKWFQMIYSCSVSREEAIKV